MSLKWQKANLSGTVNSVSNALNMFHASGMDLQLFIKGDLYLLFIKGDLLFIKGDLYLHQEPRVSYLSMN